MVGRTTCYFSGEVQGVGFRYTSMDIASEFEVTGFVRNLSDGRVELVVEGEEKQRRAMIAAVRQHMGSYVDDVQVTDSPATGEFTRFGILH